MSSGLIAISTEGYSIQPAEYDRRLSVTLTGTFDMTSAANLQNFLSQVLAVVNAKQGELTLNVCDVQYMGSSCLKAFVSLTESLKESAAGVSVRVLTDGRLDWQARTFSVLARLSPETVKVERINR